MLEELQETDIREEGIAALAPQGGNAMASIENATPPGMPVANIIEQQELARNASEAQLIEYAKSPRPDVIPPYLVTSELMRRKTVREKAAKAPQFTVAQEAVQQAEQGIMNQMQLQAPKMPPGGAVPGREQITREQIMEKGIAPLPNPGQPSMTGFAEGGIIGFAAGGNEGLYSGRGGYMPQVKGKNALQELTFRDPVNPRTRPGLYQDYNLNQGPGMSMEDYQAQTEAILGPDRSERISTLQEEFVTPFDEQINLVESQLSETGIRNTGSNPYDYASSMNYITDEPYVDPEVKNNLERELAALNQQRELYFDQASDPQIKQRMEQFQAEVAASSPDALNSEAGIKPLQPSQPGPQLPDFSGLAGEIKGDGSIFPPYTRLDAGEEAAGALGYFKEQLGEDPNRAAQVARLADIEAKGLERSARDRKMNISSALFKAADAFNKPGAYGAQIGSALAAGGQEYVTGANAISDREEKLDDKLFTLNNAMAQADRAEKVAAAKFGANSYQAAQAYNRKLEIQERADRLKSQQIEVTGANTLALAKFQRQINEGNKDDAAKVGKIKRELEEKIRKEPTEYGISSPEAPFLKLEEKASNSDERNAKIRAVKQKLEDIIARKTLEDGEIQALGGRLPNSPTQSNVVDFSSLK